MITIISAGALISALCSSEVHPSFPCKSDPVEREMFAQIWKRQQVRSAATLFVCAIFCESLLALGLQHIT